MNKRLFLILVLLMVAPVCMVGQLTKQEQAAEYREQARRYSKEAEDFEKIAEKYRVSARENEKVYERNKMYINDHRGADRTKGKMAIKCKAQMEEDLAAMNQYLERAKELSRKAERCIRLARELEAER